MTEYLRIAWNNLRNAEKRTWLTIVGIFIGIAAVVALISMGQGLQQSIDAQFEKIGSDKLFIGTEQDLAFGGMAGGDVSNPLTKRDVDAVRSVQGVEAVTSYTMRSARIEIGRDVQFNFVGGLSTDKEDYDLMMEVATIDLAQGRHLRPGDKSAVLIGNDYTRTSVFLEPVSTGDRITVNGKKFTIAGIFEPIGNSMDDRMIWMPKESFDTLFDTGDTVSTIIVRVQKEENPTTVAEHIERALLNSRGLREDNKDFVVTTPEELLESFNTILIIVNIVIIGIASISLLVGGIGIMNTMYTAVLERTKEIGIMKAIGASPHNIKMIFLTESGMLGLGGGIIGVIAGLGIALLVEMVGRAAMGNDFLSAWISPWLIIGALLFSTLVGMLSGYLPAAGAAKQHAVDSLRYE